MNLPAKTQDVWTSATDGDKLTALASLGGLPSRQTSSAEFDQATFYVGLEGVTRFGLAEAVKAILQGALGHAFFPSPPELRIQCNKAMEHHERMAERVRRQAEITAFRPKPFVEPTPEQKAHVAALHEQFHANINDGKVAEATRLFEAERTDIRARYGMTSETLAAMKDNPVAKERMGAKS